ncbi:MAG TPA: tetratricopeptide repeat protein [Bacillota bacterium]|nr:tetratricopeptide repeat protein [Bacillota bacterium]
MQPTIGLAMIVHNDQDHLAQCLESVKGQVQEMVIVDIGSTDETKAIARQYTDKVFEFSWDDDFSAARNFSIDQLTTSWVLIMNADERLEETTSGLERLLTQHPDTDAFCLNLYQNAPDHETEDTFPDLRLFRRDPDYRFEGRVYETLQLPATAKCLNVTKPIIHRISTPESLSRAKHERNLDILQRMDSESSLVHYAMGLELFHLKQYEEALPHLQKALNSTQSDDILRMVLIRYLIRCLNALGKHAEAIGICIRETKRYPDYCDLHFEGGVIFEGKAEYPLAIKWFMKAVECPRPAPGYFHTVGTESFLSLYHLGFCHEMKKEYPKAEEYYQQAITANPHFYKPLQRLFLMKSALSDPSTVLNALFDSEMIQTTDQALFLGELLFDIGYYRLANRCLEKALQKNQAADTYLLQQRLARYENYSGNPEKALHRIGQLRTSYETVDPETATEEVMALLLLGDYPAAAEKASALSGPDQLAETATAILTMTTLATKNTLSGIPENTKETAVVERILSIIERCLSFIPDSESLSETLPLFINLASLGIRTLTALSPESATALIRFIDEKTDTIRQLMNYKFNLS